MHADTVLIERPAHGNKSRRCGQALQDVVTQAVAGGEEIVEPDHAGRSRRLHRLTLMHDACLSQTGRRPVDTADTLRRIGLLRIAVFCVALRWVEARADTLAALRAVLACRVGLV